MVKQLETYYDWDELNERGDMYLLADVANARSKPSRTLSNPEGSGLSPTTTC
jgi:hypothetical protein